MRAVMYGAGNIGRGFIGALFSESGYEVAFIDVDEAVVNSLNERREYVVRAVDNSGYSDALIRNVFAVDGRDAALVAETIADARIMATAVGVNVLGRIAPVLRAGLRLRWARNGGPLNIIICENKLHADKYLAELIKSELSEDEQKRFDAEVGLIEASIGRMVPVMTDEQKREHPLMVCVEPYCILPVDLEAFKGTAPEIKNMAPRKNFGFYVERKLFVHNCGHAIAAYLGQYKGLTYIYEAMENPYIRLIVENAMLESVRTLVKRAPEKSDELHLNMFDLFHRFKNRALKDTAQRVGADPKRKLGRDDRLVGAARAASEGGVFPSFILLGAAAGMLAYKQADPDVSLERVLGEEGGLSEELVEHAGSFFEAFSRGAELSELFELAERARKRNMGDVL